DFPISTVMIVAVIHRWKEFWSKNGNKRSFRQERNDLHKGRAIVHAKPFINICLHCLRPGCNSLEKGDISEIGLDTWSGVWRRAIYPQHTHSACRGGIVG